MITTLTGENWFGLRSELDKLVGSFVAEHTDMAVERLDGGDASYERMREAVESLPFLTSCKLVILRTPSIQKAFQENIDDFLQAITDSTNVIIIEPKLDKRLVYYKTLKKQTELREFPELDALGLVKWASSRAKELGVILSTNDARFLVERIGLSQQLLDSELGKLALAAQAGVIAKETIMLLTEPTPQSTIFELLEAAFSGNHKHAAQLYEEQRLLKVDPQQIIAMLTWQLHVLALIKTAGERSPETIAKEAKLNPFVVKKSVSQARHLTLVKLKQLIRDLAVIDIRLKRESVDSDAVLKTYLLSLS